MTNEELVVYIKNGIEPEKNMLQLWQQNSGFIGSIAQKYVGYEDEEDLKQQGYIGLCCAVDGYNPEEKVPFINYAAFWIKQSMMRYIENSGGIIRIPVAERQKLRKYNKLKHEFVIETGREPTDNEICRYMSISRKQLQDMKRSSIMANVGSLDCYLAEDDDTTVGDLVASNDDVEGSVLNKVEQKQLRDTIWPIVDSLPERQPKVIRAIYQEGKTLKATGDEIGVSIEQTRKIKQKAINMLRKPERREKLIIFKPNTTYRHVGISEFKTTWTSSTESAALK